MAPSGSQDTMQRWRISTSVEHAMPSEVVFELAYDDSVEAFHPTFPSAVISIDVLSMKRVVSDANALDQIDRFVNDTAMFGVAQIVGRGLGTQHRLAVQTRADAGVIGMKIDRVQSTGQRMTLPIAHDPNPDFVVGIAAFPSFLLTTTALAGRAVLGSRSLVRSPHHDFIGFGNPCQSLVLHVWPPVRQKNRWRHRKTVLRWTPAFAADRLTLSPSIKAWA